MSNLSGIGQVNEIPQVDWDNFNPQAAKSKWNAPPTPVGPDNKPLTYYVQLPSDMSKPERVRTTQKGDRSFALGPLTFVKSGNSAVDGQTIRFYDASVKLFVNKDGGTSNVNAIGKVLRAAGITAKPQTDEQYQQAVKGLAGRVIPVYIDWEARDRETGYTLRGYSNFTVTRTNPETGAVTTSVQPILRAGDILPDGSVVQQEVLFANPVIKTVLDPNKK
jgi:hypothetical protein